jgi:hypothetical protein
MSKEKAVRRVEDLSNAVNEMHAAMAKTPEKEQERQLELTAFQKKYPNARRLEPTTRIPTGGVKHPEFEKQREYLTEYVVGVFESQMISGALDFFLSGLPGDDYCRWVIPVNKQVGVPRFVAQHISSGLGWKEMKPLGRDNQPKEFYEEEMMEPFGKFEYKKRGHFHPINAYS